MKRQFEDYSEYKSELFLPELIVFLFNRIRVSKGISKSGLLLVP